MIHQLPVPRLTLPSDAFAAIVRLSRAVTASPGHGVARAELQARVARAYGLDEEDLRHVLATFPLVPDDEREAALGAFRHVRDGL